MEVENSGEAIQNLESSLDNSERECRLCLKKWIYSELWDLFRDGEETARKIMALAAVQIEEGDGLPTTICFSCHKLLLLSYDFKCQVEKSDTTLRHFLMFKTSVKDDISNASLAQSVDAVITEAIADELSREQISGDLKECIDVPSIAMDEPNNPVIQSIEHLTEHNFTGDQDAIIFEVADNRQQGQFHEEENEACTLKNEQNFDGTERKSEIETPREVVDADSLSNRPSRLSESNFELKLVKCEESSREVESDVLEDEERSYDGETMFEESAVKIEARNYSCAETRASVQRTTRSDMRSRSAGQGTKNNGDSDDERSLIRAKRRKPRRERCPHCLKTTFSTKSALRKHIAAHKSKTLKLRYVCYVCDKQFVNVTKLKSHIANSHDSHMSDEKTCDEGTAIRSSQSDRDGENWEGDDSGTTKVTSPGVEKKNYKFTCNVCARQFTYQKSFMTHAKTHSGHKSATPNDNSERSEDAENRDGSAAVNESDDDDMPLEGLQCTQCGKVFATKRNLKRHVLTHKGLKFNCSTCGKEFSRVDKLKEHEQSKHKDELFGRSDDDYNNDDDDYTDDENKANDASENRKREKNNRPHRCALCPKAFAQAQSLANHMERHKRVKDTQKRFLCEVCSKCFAQSGSLVAHMRTHTGVKPYVCNVCSRAFTKSTYLQLHLRTHSGEKPYICQYCSRAFARANTLARHITMHTGEAKYHCQICMKSFRRLTSLNEHTYTHTGQRPYACKICTKRYNNAGSLYAHTKKCKTQQLSGSTATYTVSMDNATHQNGAPVPQMLIYSQRKLVEDNASVQVHPSPQFMIANIHNQKPLPTNVIQPFTVEDPNVYNTKPFKNPYYTIYPNM